MSKPKKYHNARLETVKDVRTLRECDLCTGLGHSNSMIVLDGTARYVHGRCFIASQGLDAFLALPREQIIKMRLDDIGSDAMKALLSDS